MSDAVMIALISGPVFIIFDRLMSWLVSRGKTNIETKKTDATTGLTIDQRWERWADNLEGEVQNLKSRVTDLETQLTAARSRENELRTLLRRVVRWALQMRELLTQKGADIPPMPDEVESALIYLDSRDNLGGQ